LILDYLECHSGLFQAFLTQFGQNRLVLGFLHCAQDFKSNLKRGNMINDMDFILIGKQKLCIEKWKNLSSKVKITK
jgi:hypothetical protein